MMESEPGCLLVCVADPEAPTWFCCLDVLLTWKYHCFVYLVIRLEKENILMG